MKYTLAALSLSTSILAQSFVPPAQGGENFPAVPSWGDEPFGQPQGEPSFGGDFENPSGVEDPSGNEASSEYRPSKPTGEGYELIKDMSGETFFDHFYFYADEDPTHGYVDYTDMKTAMGEGMAGWTDSGE